MHMLRDPVVQEVRDNFARFAEECGNDFDRIIERLRREQSAHADRLISRPPAPAAQIRPTDSTMPPAR